MNVDDIILKSPPPKDYEGGSEMVHRDVANHHMEQLAVFFVFQRREQWNAYLLGAVAFLSKKKGMCPACGS